MIRVSTFKSLIYYLNKILTKVQIRSHSGKLILKLDIYFSNCIVYQSFLNLIRELNFKIHIAMNYITFNYDQASSVFNIPYPDMFELYCL
jgi:hypothetical protein